MVVTPAAPDAVVSTICSAKPEYTGGYVGALISAPSTALFTTFSPSRADDGVDRARERTPDRRVLAPAREFIV